MHINVKKRKLGTFLAIVQTKILTSTQVMFHSMKTRLFDMIQNIPTLSFDIYDLFMSYQN